MITLQCNGVTINLPDLLKLHFRSLVAQPGSCYKELSSKERSMGESKWLEFENPDEYRLEDLGRAAVFVIPLRALEKVVCGATVEKDLLRFLVENFSAFTTMSMENFGVWKDSGHKVIADGSRMFEVSFKGKDRIPLLIAELARIAKLTGEECIYLKAGQYSCLVYPR